MPLHRWIKVPVPVETSANAEQGVGIDGTFDAQNDVVQAGTDIWVTVKNGVRFYASMTVALLRQIPCLTIGRHPNGRLLV
jgi:hypothetical protein